MSVTSIPTHYALIKRAQKMLKEIDGYFDDAESFGLTLKESDPKGEMLAIRKGIIGMLERERTLGRLKP